MKDGQKKAALLLSTLAAITISEFSDGDMLAFLGALVTQLGDSLAVLSMDAEPSSGKAQAGNSTARPQLNNASESRDVSNK